MTQPKPKAAAAGKRRPAATLRTFAKVFFNTDTPTPAQIDDLDTKLAAVDAQTTEENLTRIAPAITALRTSIATWRNTDNTAADRRGALTNAMKLIATTKGICADLEQQLLGEAADFDAQAGQ